MENGSPEKSVTEKVTDEEIKEALNIWSGERRPVKSVNDEMKLPSKDVRNILVTSALPYVNNIPHLGNIIGSVLSADVFARYCRLRDYNVVYVCGTDEYGTATETKALEENTTPEKICEKYHKLHSDTYEWFRIKFDKFGRTTTSQQTEISQEIFWKVYKNGYCLENEIEQLYCGSCERFLADRFVEGTCPFCGDDDARGDQCDKCGKLVNAPELKSPKCKLCKTAPSLKSSKHLFLDLPKLEPKLKEWFQKTTGEDTCWTQTAKVIANAWLKEGLKPRCISRDLKWGTPVPLEGYTDKVFYVWFDAPIGYLSITANYCKDWEKWWKNPKEVELYQFMAKDNVPFHGIVFPATQLATGDDYTLVNHLVAVEYLNYEDTKFSKSRGIGIFGDQVKDTGIPSDIWRFYLLYIRPETQDSSFSWNDLMTKNNSELLNNLGNFVNRALSFLVKNFEGIIPKIVLNEEDQQLLALINREVKSYVQLLEKAKLRDALRHVLNISRLGNQYMQSSKPWVLLKGTEEEKSRSASVTALCANISALLSLLLSPFTPDTSANLQNQLNWCQTSLDIEGLRQFLKEGHKLGTATPLFRKLEQTEIDLLKKRFSGAAKNVTVVETCTEEQLQQMVTEQGNKIRELKLKDSEKAVIAEEVQVLKELKERWSRVSGQPVLSEKSSGRKKGNKAST